jgi:hypothetical protein
MERREKRGGERGGEGRRERKKMRTRGEKGRSGEGAKK